MEMNIFAAKVRSAVEKELGNGFEVSIRKVLKNNGVCLTGLVARAKDGDVAPTLYLENFLEAYEKGYPFAQAIQKILQVYQMNQVEGSADIEFFRHFEEVRDRICYRLVGKKGNKALLDGVPCMEFLDLAVCFYYAYEGEFGEGSILVHNNHMEMWGTSTVELARLAHANTPRLFPPRYGNMAEILAGEGQALDDREAYRPAAPFPGGIPMKILTNSKRSYGAACILYPGVLGRAAERMGGDFYILPSSLHEVILLPYDGGASARALKEMISEINGTQVAPEEVLSDSLYYYNAGAKEARLVE